MHTPNRIAEVSGDLSQVQPPPPRIRRVRVSLGRHVERAQQHHRAGHELICYERMVVCRHTVINSNLSRPSQHTNGVYEGVAIGGDRYPGTTFWDHIIRYEANPNIKMMVLLGEVGGTEEYLICDAIKDGRITKPLVAWCVEIVRALAEIARRDRASRCGGPHISARISARYQVHRDVLGVVQSHGLLRPRRLVGQFGARNLRRQERRAQEGARFHQFIRMYHRPVLYTAVM